MANEKKGAIERFAESAFMKKMQVGSQKLASNEIFSTISGGMGATMGLIMIGAVIQIVCAVGAMFGWDTSSASYQAFYMPYKLTMGLMGFFMAFSMSWNFAKRKKMNQMQSVITAYTTNSTLAAAGQPLQFFPVFLMVGNGIMGGAGNTMPFSLMGLKSKSKRIQAVSRASFVPGLFGINEPAIFGYPIMYNGLLLIPFMLCPMVCSALALVAWNLHLMAYPQVLIMTTMPVVFGTFLSTLDWRNVIYSLLMFPICWLIWRPFYKIYEKQCIEEEAAAEAAELAAQNK